MTTRLDEFDKTEWLAVARQIKPGMTEKDYAQMWHRFVAAKAEHVRKKGLQ